MFDIYTSPEGLLVLFLVVCYTVIMTLLVTNFMRKNKRKLVFLVVGFVTLAILFFLVPEAFLSPGKFFGL